MLLVRGWMGNGCIFWAIKQINLIQIYMNIARILEFWKSWMYLRFRKGARKNSIKVLSFAKQGGGGSSTVVNKQTNKLLWKAWSGLILKKKLGSNIVWEAAHQKWGKCQKQTASSVTTQAQLMPLTNLSTPLWPTTTTTELDEGGAIARFSLGPSFPPLHFHSTGDTLCTG